MRPDIVELERFYDSRAGDYVRRRIRQQLRALWPDIGREVVLGIGYATPFLGIFGEAAATPALMPATQGVGREDELPFADGSVDRVVLTHALECSPHANRLMREVWRVLKDGGRLAVVAPNRRGLWCWSERTPFGFGQPYSIGQLERTLRNHLFVAAGERRALYMPPLGGAFLLRLSIPLERAGLRFAPHFAGLLIVEAEKRIHVAPPVFQKVRPSSRRYIPVPAGAVARDRSREPERAPAGD